MAGITGLVLVITACAESFFHGSTDPAILVLATSVVASYFTGAAVKQVNGLKVDALTQAVIGLHTRMDKLNIPPAADGIGVAH